MLAKLMTLPIASAVSSPRSGDPERPACASANATAIGTRNTIYRNGVRYRGWIAPNQDGR